MAFHQPTRQSIQRVVRPAQDEPDAPRLQSVVPSDRAPDESQTWVLFAPTEVTATSYLTETDHDLETPGRSRLGDLGSLSAARSEQAQSASISAIDDVSVEDDAELDSLDSHLPEFRSLPGIYSHSQHDNPPSAQVFPGHDGLGSFRLDQPTGAEAQDQMYQFEQFNPRRLHRRQESFDLAQLQLEQQEVQETEKRQRIEAWRLEHSRVLLSEIQKETRRRRLSQASLHRRASSNVVPISPRRAKDVESDNMTWHDEDAVETVDDESEGFLARITRKVMRDVLGIDDRMLSILLGDATPDEDDLSTTPRASQHGLQHSEMPNSQSSWQVEILEKVSRELGLLVNQLSHHHPGAFSTYARVQQMPLPYAGLPIIPESNISHSAAERILPTEAESPSFPQFQPTMNQTSRPINIPGRPEQSAEATPASQRNVPMGNAFTKEEWERDLDIKLVFRYLRSRFLSHDSHASPSTGTSHLATSSTQDTAAKVARVRQHHPLISRMRPAAERRTFKATTPSSPVALRHQSSCASQSTRRSARRSSVSSRHYWDIGGSLGTGSMIASNGPMGSWGEV